MSDWWQNDPVVSPAAKGSDWWKADPVVKPAAQPGSSWIDATVNAGAKALAPIANVPSAYANETRGGVQQMGQGGQQFGLA